MLPVPGPEPEHIVGLKKACCTTSLAVQWLRFHTSTAGDVGSTPGWETKIPHAIKCGPKRVLKKKKVLHSAESPWTSKLKSDRRNSQTHSMRPPSP